MYAVYYFTRSSVPRALDPGVLKVKALQYGLSGETYEDAGSALDTAIRNASEDDLIFVGGSTFVVADII